MDKAKQHILRGTHDSPHTGLTPAEAIDRWGHDYWELENPHDWKAVEVRKCWIGVREARELSNESFLEVMQNLLHLGPCLHMPVNWADCQRFYSFCNPHGWTSNQVRDYYCRKINSGRLLAESEENEQFHAVVQPYLLENRPNQINLLRVRFDFENHAFSNPHGWKEFQVTGFFVAWLKGEDKGLDFHAAMQPWLSQHTYNDARQVIWTRKLVTKSFKTTPDESPIIDSRKEEAPQGEEKAVRGLSVAFVIGDVPQLIWFHNPHNWTVEQVSDFWQSRIKDAYDWEHLYNDPWTGVKNYMQNYLNVCDYNSALDDWDSVHRRPLNADVTAAPTEPKENPMQDIEDELKEKLAAIENLQRDVRLLQFMLKEGIGPEDITYRSYYSPGGH